MFRFFHHYVALPTILLAFLEASLFFAFLFSLTLVGIDDAQFGTITDSLSTRDLALICGLFVLLLASMGLYNRDALFEFGILLQRSIIFLFTIVFLGVLALAVDEFLPSLRLPTYISLLALATVINFFIILSIRLLVVSLPRVQSIKRRVLVLGRGRLGHRIQSFLDGDGGSTLRKVGYISLEDYDEAPDHSPSSDPLPDIGEELRALAQSKRAEEIVIASREWRGLPIWQLLECKMAGVTVTDYLSFWERETGQIDLDEVKPSWLALSDGFRVNRIREFMKRTFDIVVSLTLLTATLPLLVATAIFIVLESPGPVFYRQDRVGRHGKTFQVTKFRSMRQDAERDGKPQWATTTDPRVTRIGQFIRRSRIDEIPQILNVLLGDMSFVGPRPERPYFVDDLKAKIPLYELRHNVRPGITGWAQVNYPYGASVEDARRKLSYDLYYVKNGGLFLDLVILLQTVRVVLMGDGAR